MWLLSLMPNLRAPVGADPSLAGSSVSLSDMPLYAWCIGKVREAVPHAAIKAAAGAVRWPHIDVPDDPNFRTAWVTSIASGGERCQASPARPADPSTVAVGTKVAKEKAVVVASTGRVLRGGAHRPPSGIVPSVVSIRLAMAPGCVSMEAHDVDTEIDVIPSAWTASPSERVLRRTQPRSIQSLVYEQEGVNPLHVRLYIDGFRLPSDGKTFIFGNSEYLEILEGRLISWYAITRTTDLRPQSDVTLNCVIWQGRESGSGRYAWRFCSEGAGTQPHLYWEAAYP
jgi:hypothetical protein